MTDLAHAIKGAILGLTKLENIVQSLNNAVIHETNSPTVTTDTVATDTNVTASDTVERDDENVAWMQEIHTDSKTQVASKTVKGGKAWRLKKGVDPDLVEKLKAQSIATYNAMTGTDTAPVESKPLGLPSLAVKPKPAVTGLPGLSLPAVNKPDPSVELKIESIKIIKELIDTYGLSWEDCKEIMVDEFKVAQSGAEVTFGGLKFEQFPAVKEYFTDLVNKYRTVDEAMNTIRELATPANKQTVDEGFASLFAAVNTTELGGVHYTDIDACLKSFSEWVEMWRNWANGQ